MSNQVEGQSVSPNDAKPVLSVSLPPLDDETAAEPIQNALCATGRFTTDQCTDLAYQILQYIKDYEFIIARRQ